MPITYVEVTYLGFCQNIIPEWTDNRLVVNQTIFKSNMPLPTVILPGYLESAIAYRQLEQSLQQSGFPTVTVPLRRRDWLPTLAGRPVTPI